MPTTDTDWELTRNYVAEFVKAARANKALEVTPFSQAQYNLSMESQRAICCGLSMEYMIKLYQIKGSGGTLNGSGYSREGNTILQEAFVDAAIQVAKNLEKSDGQRSPMTQLNSNIAAKQDCQMAANAMRAALIKGESVREQGRHLNDAATKAGLKYVETFEDDSFSGHRRKVAEYLIDFEPGYYILTSPNHMMTTAYVKRKVYFFDPNLGEAVFNNYLDFKRFFVDWFGRDFIVAGYKGVIRNVSKIEPAKKLRLRVDRYIGSRARR